MMIIKKKINNNKLSQDGMLCVSGENIGHVNMWQCAQIQKRQIYLFYNSILLHVAKAYFFCLNVLII